ncbi:HI0074 family nucleotidyltransferase substrate-binding subunit [uncultured Brachyspira sp.]|uniref:HI0074 family nucleotidyltransferase substrate-binding subunit n=1 Tax=uncultured Brachyspira sp. TaxID=221953 RepID=UPI00261002B4|nr:HI0074 family nucleotidyltransferase substrate-binding subunit [uncultured Brachyspira sp.]
MKDALFLRFFMILNLDSLKKSIIALEKSINVYDRIKTDDEDLMLTIRSGVIQNFEIAFEQSWKFIQRWLNENINPDITSGITKKELFRLAAKHLLIDDVEKWIKFKDAGNSASHIYSNEVSLEVINEAEAFLPYAKYLLKRLEENNE